MITYDLTAKRLTGLSRPELRYSNAAQRMTVRLTGTMPAASRWACSVALNSKTSAEVVLTRTIDGAVTVSGNDVIIDWQTDTVTWLAACAGADNGIPATCVIRPLDADGGELDYIAFALLALPAIDPLGVIDQPSQVAAQTVITINGNVGAMSIRNSAGTALSVVNGVITLDKAAVGLGNVSNLLDNLAASAAPTATADSAAGYSAGSLWIDVAHGKAYTCVDATAGAAVWTEGGGGAGDVTAAGDNAFTGANTFSQPLTVGGRTVSGLYPDRNPVAQIPVLDAALGVCHYLDATFTEISFAYPVWKLVEIRALVRSVNAAITGTVIITPYVDDVAQTPVTISVGATWAAITIPLSVETGSIRLVRTGGTLADGSWVTAAFRGITAMVTI